MGGGTQGENEPNGNENGMRHRASERLVAILGRRRSPGRICGILASGLALLLASAAAMGIAFLLWWLIFG